MASGEGVRGSKGRKHHGMVIMDAAGEEYMEDSITEWPEEGEVVVVQGEDCDPWSDEYALRLHRILPGSSDNLQTAPLHCKNISNECSLEAGFESRGCLRISFQDLSKPRNNDGLSGRRGFRQMFRLIRLVADEPPNDVSPDSGISELHNLTPEEQVRQREEWSKELAKIEEEIQTLRHVLASKVNAAHELKRKLGLTTWREWTEDMNQSIRNVKESNVYQKTESALKATAEKTTTLLGGIGSNLSNKIGQLKNSDSFRSFEERVGSAYENVKTKIGTSRSNSTQSFDEALREADSRRSGSIGGAMSPPSATTPTIAEEDGAIVKGPLS